jgi:hypothetical protein
MDKDHSLQTSQVELEVEPMSTKAASSWTTEVMRHNGQEKEHEASCNRGEFQCNGEVSWCMEQKKSVCQATQDEDDGMLGQITQAARSALQATEPVEIARDAVAEGKTDTALVQRKSHLQGHLRA